MNILLGVCGSISAYRSYDIARGLISDGHSVKIILTRGAEKFVQTQVYRYLGVAEVYAHGDDFNFPNQQQLVADDKSTVLHITLARWCERFIIAPMTANTASTLAHGQTNDLLSSIFLSLKAEIPIIVYPAMNTQMLEHPITKKNLASLNELDNIFIHPAASGTLACGEVGAGKLPSVEAIINIAPIIFPFSPVKNLKKILITTGATISALDSVRYLTNESSGLTGFHLAQDFLSKGHQVTVIAGKKATPLLEQLVPLPQFKLIRVVSTNDMLEAVKHHLPPADIYISAAAINDIEFPHRLDQKLKKEDFATSLPIQQANDILAHVIKTKNENLKIIGFAAESQLTPAIMQKKFKRKPVDILIGTKIHSGLTGSMDSRQGFAETSGEYYFYCQENFEGPYYYHKKELSKEICQRILA